MNALIRNLFCILFFSCFFLGCHSLTIKNNAESEFGKNLAFHESTLKQYGFSMFGEKSIDNQCPKTWSSISIDRKFENFVFETGQDEFSMALLGTIFFPTAPWTMAVVIFSPIAIQAETQSPIILRRSHVVIGCLK